MARAFIHELLKAERIGVKQNTYPEPSLAEGKECTGVIFSSIFSFSSDPFKVNIRGGGSNLAFGNFPSPRNNTGSGGSNFNPSPTEFLRGLEKFPNAYLPVPFLACNFLYQPILAWYQYISTKR